jgi:hypothetical protein
MFASLGKTDAEPRHMHRTKRHRRRATGGRTVHPQPSSSGAACGTQKLRMLLGGTTACASPRPRLVSISAACRTRAPAARLQQRNHSGCVGTGQHICVELQTKYLLSSPCAPSAASQPRCFGRAWWQGGRCQPLAAPVKARKAGLSGMSTCLHICHCWAELYTISSCAAYRPQRALHAACRGVVLRTSASPTSTAVPFLFYLHQYIISIT